MSDLHLALSTAIGLNRCYYSAITAISDRQSDDRGHRHLVDVRTQPRAVPRKMGSGRVHSGAEH